MQIPLFPLQIILLPGERSVLHIFEERYRQLIDDCEQLHISFGIPFSLNGQLSQVGSAVKLLKVINRYPNGSSDIEIEACKVFRINQYYNKLGDKLYPGGEIEWIDQGNELQISARLMKAADSYLLRAKEVLDEEVFSTEIDIFDLARILNLSDLDKVRFIRTRDPKERERVLWNHLLILTKLRDQQSSFDGRNFLN